jgi:hypothetical protein
MSSKTYNKLSGANITSLCEECFDLAARKSCKDAKFCPMLTGYPWCGDHKLDCDIEGGDTDDDAFAGDRLKGVTAAMGRGCCKKYLDHTLADKCGGLPCPDHQAAAKTTANCKSCFAEGAKVGCKIMSYCTGE